MSVGMSGQDHSWTLQAIMELKGSLAQLTVTVEALRKSSETMGAKVDDLVGWKNKVLGGAAMLMFVGGLIGYGVGKLSDYVVLKPPAPTAAPTTPTQAAPPPPPAQKSPSTP
jgi:hypothetical protein